MLAAVGADPRSAEPIATRGADALRIAYRDQLLDTVVRDLVHGARIDDTAAELADLADEYPSSSDSVSHLRSSPWASAAAASSTT